MSMYKISICLICIALIYSGFNAMSQIIFLEKSMDLSPFVTAVRNMLASTTHLPTKECQIPKSGIIFSYSNHHLFPLVRLQYRAMKCGGQFDCLNQRFLTVCLDIKCHALCKQHNITNCIQLDIPETPLVGFGKGSKQDKYAYNFLTWLKYDMLKTALLYAAEQVFYFDADVILLRNPWPEVGYGRDKSGNVIKGTYDIMYQRERGMTVRDCGGSVNGGMIYMLNSSELHSRFFPKFYTHREGIINGTDRSDQDVIGDYVGLMRYCTFSVGRVLGHCPWSQDAYAPASGVVTYHTNCVSGLKNKIHLHERMVDNCQSSRSVSELGL